jgi:response regulator of citrate/malate metabolism
VQFRKLWSLKELEHQTNEQTEILKEILKWIKFAGAKEVKNALLTTLDTEQKRLIYHLSDGDHGTQEIGKVVSLSSETIRRYWAMWARQGIVESLRVRGGERYKKSFELEDFGIDVPQPKVVPQPAEPTGAAEKREAQ